MKTYKIAEFYGVAGEADKLAFVTTTLSSCSAVIMYRPGGKIGLFHYPGSALGNDQVRAVIKDMMNYVLPSKVVVWPANVASQIGTMPSYDHSRFKLEVEIDNRFLTDYLRSITTGECAFSMKSGTFAGVRVQDGDLAFGNPGGSENDLPDNLRPGRTNGEGLTVFFHAQNQGGKDYARNVTGRAADILEDARQFS